VSLPPKRHAASMDDSESSQPISELADQVPKMFAPSRGVAALSSAPRSGKEAVNLKARGRE
jgi:hypothetical protein